MMVISILFELLSSLIWSTMVCGKNFYKVYIITLLHFDMLFICLPVHLLLELILWFMQLALLIIQGKFGI